MKRAALVVAASLMVVSVVGVLQVDAATTACADVNSSQSALLRIGMNLEVSERIRKGDGDGALRLLNTMNVLEVTPLLQSREKDNLDMKRRVFRRLLAERQRMQAAPSDDKESVQLNRDIDNYLKTFE